MRGFATALIGICVCAPAANALFAGPYIIAVSVSPTCKVEANGSVSSVSVMLNGTTHSFYKKTLRYYFKPVSGGTPVVVPSPNAGTNPVLLAVPAGSYKLVISPDLVLTPNSSQSAEYAVSVPANLIISLGSKKICNKVMKESTTRIPHL